ncbi:alpha/beta hydrolase [Alphaproteobacteria bacterium]|nr:alpha/beta hydrolase [Alphaproteobacteria bacterium]
MPSHIYNRIKELGSNFNPGIVQEIYELYKPLLRNAPKSNIKIINNIFYGENKRQCFDMFYSSKNEGKKLPAIIYIHGGGFTQGHKNAIPEEPDLIHGNIATFFARNNFIGINATYRLAPKYKWPSGKEDIKKIIEFIHINSEKYRIDKDSIFLFGQSAGASHVASYIFDEKINLDEYPIAGSILFSGVYDLLSMPSGPVKEYYGEDSNNFFEMSSKNFVKFSEIPLLISTCEFDPQLFKDQAIQLKTILENLKKNYKFIQIPNHNHLSQVIHLNTEDTAVSNDLIYFINKFRK